MKALIGTAAVVVISTCGYFVYEDISMKQRIKARMEYRRCIDGLESVKELLDPSGSWEAQTTEMRVETLRRNNGSLIADIFEDQWEECGPI